MSHYLNSATANLKPYAESAMFFLNSSKDSIASTYDSGSETVSSFALSIINTVSNTASSTVDQAKYLKDKAINIISTIRMTAHGATDGMLVGMGIGFLAAGPLGLLNGAWIGSVVGGLYGFCKATDNDFDRASYEAQQNCSQQTVPTKEL